MGALTRFAAIPERAGDDRRLRLRDLRVLIAVCRAVDGRTGLAVISQKRIGERSGCSRQKANAAVGHLVRCGYLKKVDKRYSRSGGGGFLVYRIIYEERAHQVGVTALDDAAPVAHEDDTPHVTLGDDVPVSRPGVTHYKAETTNPDKDTGQSARSRTAITRGDDGLTEGTRAWREHRDQAQERMQKLFSRSFPRRGS